MGTWQYGYTPLKISTLVDGHRPGRTRPRLYAFENFYSCRYSDAGDDVIGYTPLKISTLVDLNCVKFNAMGYTPLKISTLVDPPMRP